LHVQVQQYRTRHPSLFVSTFSVVEEDPEVLLVPEINLVITIELTSLSSAVSADLVLYAQVLPELVANAVTSFPHLNMDNLSASVHMPARCVTHPLTIAATIARGCHQRKPAATDSQDNYTIN